MFTDCYCTQFRRSANALTSIYDNALRNLGIKVTQLAMLRALNRLGSASYNEIAAELALDKTTVSRNIKLLIDAGWVKIESDEDARYKVAKLSASGARLLRDSEPYWHEAQKQVEKELGQYLKNPSKSALLNALESLQHMNT